MNLQLKIALAVIGVSALVASPTALAMGQPDGVPHGKGDTNGHGAKAKAWGQVCKEESRKRDGEGKGTPFSRCVRNMAQATHHKGMAPGRVCKEESRKRDGEGKGTPFSRCVHNVNELRRQERREAA